MSLLKGGFNIDNIERNKDMEERIFYTAGDVAAMLDVSMGHAYSIIRSLNEELKKKKYIVIAGKVSKAYFNEKFYGLTPTV